MKEYPLIKVTWTDACNYTERVAEDYNFTLIPVQTIGYLLREDKEKLILFRDVYVYGTGDDQIRIDGVIVIPIRCVKERAIIEIQ